MMLSSDAAFYLAAQTVRRAAIEIDNENALHAVELIGNRCGGSRRNALAKLGRRNDLEI
jgi:hypothetical protein